MKSRQHEGEVEIEPNINLIYEIHLEATINFHHEDDNDGIDYDDRNQLIRIGSALSSKADPQMRKAVATDGGRY